MKYLYLLLFCMFCACATGNSPPEEEYVCPANEVTVIKNTNPILIVVYADNSFPYEKKMALSAAFAEWSIKTDNKIHFDIVFVSPKQLKNDASVRGTYYVFNRNPQNSTFAGFCQWLVGYGAVIEIRPDTNIFDFVPVALHEIGHALNLQHYSGKYTSIMTPSLENNRDISCYDLQQFCRQWGCSTTCTLEEVEKQNISTRSTSTAIDLEP